MKTDSEHRLMRIIWLPHTHLGTMFSCSTPWMEHIYFTCVCKVCKAQPRVNDRFPRVLPVIAEDLLPNLIRHPRALVKVE